MLLLSLTIIGMLKTQFVVEMAIILMGIDCELNSHMVGGDLHHRWIVIAVTVVWEEAEVFLGAQTIVFWSLDYLLLHHGKT